jgi:hypothetical protein
MTAWVVFHYYNARTDNDVCGIFASKELAINYVAEQIKEYDREDWKIEDNGYNIEFKKSYDNSYEITQHEIITN